MPNHLYFWIFFNLFVVVMLFLDLFVFHKKDHAIKIREALAWTVFWITLAALFNLGVYFFQGPHKALEFTTGYLIEYSLSVDNLFVFLLIFNYFRVPHHYQYKVLFWGILGAVVSRIIFIILGVALIERFHWILYLFGAFLIFTGIKMLVHKGEEIHPENNPVIKITQKVIPLVHHYEDGKFFIKSHGKWFATPLLVVLIFIDVMDIVFATDSIPAIFSITLDPVIVYSSNIFAVLGLRSLYFALHGMMQLFHYLHYGIALILAFVGVKILIQDLYDMPEIYALAFIVIVLALSVIASILWPKKEKPGHAPSDLVEP
ncbi:MAG: TerC family protein [Candidatus Omnitrophica bacterium]|nr:TerC family protein [Candidatus Omnitrophota bacterium]